MLYGYPHASGSGIAGTDCVVGPVTAAGRGLRRVPDSSPKSVPYDNVSLMLPARSPFLSDFIFQRFPVICLQIQSTAVGASVFTGKVRMRQANAKPRCAFRACLIAFRYRIHTDALKTGIAPPRTAVTAGKRYNP